MSIAEIKAEAQRLPADEVRHLAAYLHHLARRGEADYVAGLERAWTAAEAGDRVPLAEVKRLDDELRAAGLIWVAASGCGQFANNS